MELCDKDLSKSLKEKIIKTRKGFDIEEIRDIINQLNNIFKVMIENNIIHRDLKLENILIKNDYTFKITDYGCSKKLDSLSKFCFTKNVGALINMTPEILNEEPYDYKCDLWSIGVILYRLYFGKSPFPIEKEEGLKKYIAQFGNTVISKSGNVKYDDLIKLLLEKDSSKRLTWDKYFNHQFFKEYIDIDIIPFSLGIEEGDLISVFIKKGSPLPITQSKIILITKDGQTSMKFKIYEGENKYTKYNHYLGNIVLCGNIPREKGQTKVEIEFFVDMKLILYIKAKNLIEDISQTCKFDLNKIND